MPSKKAAVKTPEKSEKSAKSNSKQANTSVETLLKSSSNTTKSASCNSSKVELPTVKKTQPKTKVTVKYNAGFSNELFIRGEGANLNWEKGQKLKNICADEWVWETNQNFSKCEFKILINDEVYEKGDNHLLKEGGCSQHTPYFS